AVTSISTSGASITARTCPLVTWSPMSAFTSDRYPEVLAYWSADQYASTVATATTGGGAVAGAVAAVAGAAGAVVVDCALEVAHAIAATTRGADTSAQMVRFHTACLLM